MQPDGYEQILKILMVRIRAYATSRIGADLADEVVQESLMLLHAKYSHVRDELELTKLGLTVANLKTKEVRRRHPSRRGLDDEGVSEPSEQRPSPYDRTLLAQVKAAIPSLDAECRQILRMKLLGHDYDDIAQALKKSKGALYVQCSRCHEKLALIVKGRKKAFQA